MIFELFKAQIIRLAAAVARDSGRAPVRERERFDTVAATVSASVVDLFVAAGLRPEFAEIAARAYAAGWLDAANRESGASLADAVIERRVPTERDRNHAAPRLLN
ncbi:MAG: hypothetical protein O9256_01945 [Rhizobiaceae bacterium]|nr:hypothetical protein [Rhizobiaceae bacterium]MCZ8349844.1 hypothetical protein [Rhizobium sp.]